MRFKNHTLTLLLGAALVGCATAPPPAPAKVAAPAPAAVAPAAPAPVAESTTPPSPAAVVNMVNNCFSCHGTDGRSPGAIPSLTNRNAQQDTLVLKGFKSGARASTVMARHAKGYTDVELEAIANYIGNLK
ncbi:MAG: c-type cytochrome [Pseudomonadota bacterium]